MGSRGRGLWILAVLIARAGVACPDFGVAVKAGAGDYAGIPIRTTAKFISAQGPDGTSYNFHWKGTSQSGTWCYGISSGGGYHEKCLNDPQARKDLESLGVYHGNGNPEILIRNKSGQVIAVARFFQTPNTLAGTRQKGPFMTFVKASGDPNRLSYEGPMLRFAYNMTSKPLDFDTNDLRELEKQLQSQGVSRDDAMKRYQMVHHMYADLFSKKDSGILGGNPNILGTMRVSKKEVPFAPVPRGLGGSGEADLQGNHYAGKKDAGGCTTTVDKITAEEADASGATQGH